MPVRRPPLDEGVNVASDGLGGLSFTHPMPKAVRDYGKVLDPSILEPGDLILVSSKRPNFVARTIRSHQDKQFPEEHARWQHAAVSGGGFEICEATTSGVKACEYWAYMTGAHDIKVRRVAGEDASVRSRIAYYAATSTGVPYGFINAVNMKAILGRGDPWNRPWIRSAGIICSQLYFEACMRVGIFLANIPSESVCPAHLSMSNLLEDVLYREGIRLTVPRGDLRSGGAGFGLQ